MENEKTKKMDLRDYMLLKKNINNKSYVEKVLSNMYYLGIKAQMGNDFIVDNESRFLHIKPDTVYEFVCPNCGETTCLDMNALLKEQEEKK